MYFGRSEHRKGVLQLVEACSHLWDKGVDFKLKMIGGEKIINKLKQKKILVNCHVVALSSTEKNQLDIYSSKFLFQPGFPTEDLFVVAIVKSHEDAIEFVENLLKDVYNETKRTDMRSYILEKEQDG